MSLVRSLLPRTARLEVETHPCVWASAFDQPQAGRITVCLLNYQLEGPPIPIAGARVRLGLPAGRRCRTVQRAPDLSEVAFDEPTAGRVVFEAGPLALFGMFVIEHVPA